MVKQFIKNITRKSLNFLHLDITKNLRYDRQTKECIARIVQRDSVCIDVGCHKGEIFDLFIRSAPNISHYGFEPIPNLYNDLIKKYCNQNIFSFALSDSNGVSTFQWVKNAAAYSGIKQRQYAIKNPIIEEIKVELRMLDDLIPETENIRLIKIDVEGAELSVLKGAKKILQRCKPFIIFECGQGASDFYGTRPENVFDFLNNDVGLKISLLQSWLIGQKPLSEKEFVEIYETNREYYFIAHLWQDAISAR